MQSFDFVMRTRIVGGENSLRRIGELSAELTSGRVLLVTDPGIVAAGHVDRAVEAIESEGLSIQVFDGAAENPTTQDVQRGVEVAREFKPDLLIGLGGGSSMDCAKGINFIYSCGGTMHDYAGVGKATAPMLPMIAVPTTAGTGSELQSFALISDAETHVKMACGDPAASCRVAILDPLLTLTQPKTVTALTGIDAISHALETMVTTRRNPVSRTFSVAAWKCLANHFETVISNPDNLSSRSAMQLGAAWAGLAIENSMLGASHALANPLTARFGIPHGQAVGLMLPHVIRFNGQDAECRQAYAELLSDLELVESNASTISDGNEAGAIADLVTRLVLAAGMKTKLSELNVNEEHFAAMAADAAQQWTGTFNPIPVDKDSLFQLYRNAA
jgi:alcohol dehydrogenase